jgi:hypothetical protein
MLVSSLSALGRRQIVCGERIFPLYVDNLVLDVANLGQQVIVEVGDIRHYQVFADKARHYSSEQRSKKVGGEVGKVRWIDHGID